jgi:alkyl sulfatase BDS1-like metallo-beta-lactamase superfamily hydrolase
MDQVVQLERVHLAGAQSREPIADALKEQAQPLLVVFADELSRRPNVILRQTTLRDQIAAGTAQIQGNEDALHEFISLLDIFEFWFNIVTPPDSSSRAIGFGVL